MVKSESSVVRIHNDLKKELERLSKLNNIKLIEASKSIAKISKKCQGRSKLLKEIKF